MDEHGDVPVAVLSSHPTLDLAINIWVPGYVAWCTTDIDTVIDLTADDGVIVIDLSDAGGQERLQSLHDRRIATPKVVVNAGGRSLPASVAEGVVVADSTQVKNLMAALETAARRRSVRPASDAPAPATPAPSATAPAAAAAPEAGVPQPPAPTAPAAAAAPEAGVPQPPAPPAPAAPAAPAARTTSPPEPPFVAANQPPASRQGDGAADGSVNLAVTRARRLSRKERPPATERRRWWPLWARANRGSALSDPAHNSAETASSSGSRSEAGELAAPGDDLLFDEAAGEPGYILDPTAPLFERQEAGDDRAIRFNPDIGAEVSIDPVVVGRSWIVLDELKDMIGSGSAVVAVRASDSSYATVAGVGLAPFEADRTIRASHPVMQAVRQDGWFIRSHEHQAEPLALTPLLECDEFMALAMRRDGGLVDGVVLIGRFVPFTTEEARAAATVVTDTGLLDERLRRLQGPALRSMVATADEGGPLVPADLVRAGWRLLDELFPLMGGAAAVVTLQGGETVFVPTAAVGVEAQIAARFVPATHPLLKRMHAGGGSVLVQAANADRGLVGGLPLPDRAFVAAIAVGELERHGGVVLFTRKRRFTDDELAILTSTIRDHRLDELVQSLRQRKAVGATE